MAEIKCPKCAGPVQFDAGTKFTKCSYCSSQIYIDRSGAGFYYAIPFTLSESDAVGTFKRWAGVDQGQGPAAGPGDQSARSTSGVHVPAGCRRPGGGPAGTGRLDHLPGCTTEAARRGPSDFRRPVQHQRRGDGQPDIAMTHYLSPSRQGQGQSLVYFPIWELEYRFKGTDYQVVVDASSSEVFASFPPAAPGLSRGVDRGSSPSSPSLLAHEPVRGRGPHGHNRGGGVRLIAVRGKEAVR